MSAKSSVLPEPPIKLVPIKYAIAMINYNVKFSYNHFRKNASSALAVDTPTKIFKRHHCHSLVAYNKRIRCVAKPIKHLSGNVVTALTHKFLEHFNYCKERQPNFYVDFSALV